MLRRCLGDELKVLRGLESKLLVAHLAVEEFVDSPTLPRDPKRRFVWLELDVCSQASKLRPPPEQDGVPVERVPGSFLLGLG